MSNLCIDTGGLMYAVIAGLTQNVTGSFFFSLFVIVLILLVIAIGLGIPIEFTMILVLPFLLGLLACDGTEWLSISGVALIYLGILFGKNFFFND